MKRPAGVIVGSLGILFAGVVLFACGSSGSSNDSPPLDEASTPAPDGQAEAADGRDSATKDGGADVVAIDAPDLANYHDLTDNKLWESADGALTGGPRGGGLGGAFDGRYVYGLTVGSNLQSAPLYIHRFDSQAPFAVNTSWSKFDIFAIDSSLGFNGAVFDGKYMYFVPSTGATPAVSSTPSGRTLRYDTTAPFDQLASWKKLDLATVDAAAKGYSGGTFDGRYVYYAPNYNGAFHGHAARFDTKADFLATASWTTFDMGALPTPATGCSGSVFDGRYVYFIATRQGTTVMATLARFDTTHASFDDATAWSSILVPGVPTNAFFQGATFDGRWLYLVPSGPATPAVRFDTKAALSDMTAWSAFSLSFIPQLDSLMTGIFDNRFVYFLPRGFTMPTIVRYDTHAPFAAAGSWTSYAVGQVKGQGVTTALGNTNVQGLAGGAFDGRHLYLAPNASHYTLRFDAKDPPAFPKAYHGSFF